MLLIMKNKLILKKKLMATYKRRGYKIRRWREDGGGRADCVNENENPPSESGGKNN